MQLQPVGNTKPNAEAIVIDRPVAPAAPVAEAAQTAASPDTGNPVPPLVPEPQLGEVTEAVGTINKTMKALSNSLEFSIDADSKRAVVKVIDPDTKEVIRQMPSAEALEIAKALDRLQGLLIRQQA